MHSRHRVQLIPSCNASKSFYNVVVRFILCKNQTSNFLAMTRDPLRIHNLKKTCFERCCRTPVFSFSGSWGLHFAIFKNTCSKCPEITAYKVVHLGCGRGQLFLATTTMTLDRVYCQFWNSPEPPMLWTVQMKQSYYSCVYFIPQ